MKPSPKKLATRFACQVLRTPGWKTSSPQRRSDGGVQLVLDGAPAFPPGLNFRPTPVTIGPGLKYYHFYHIYADGGWQLPCQEHLAALRASGLLAQLEAIQIGIVGSAENRRLVKEFFAKSAAAFNVCAESEKGWEQVTLNKLHDFAANDGFVLYAHTKGAAFNSPKKISWRRTMTRYTVFGWREATMQLNAHHAAGCYWNGMFFSGTFWWTKLEHIRSLDKPKASNRFQAETWIAQINGAKMLDLRHPDLPMRNRQVIERLIDQDVKRDKRAG